MTCKECEFWERTDDYSGEHGLCSRTEFDELGYCSTDNCKNAPMITKDGSAYMAELYTLSSHSCNEFKDRTGA